MAQMADVTVKKADGVTNVTYSALVASAGDSQDARWSSNSSSAIRGNRDSLSMSAQFNGPRTARRAVIKGDFPVRVIQDGVETVQHRIPFALTVTLPLAVTDAQVQEAIHQFTNFCASALVRDSLISGYAPV